MQPSSGEGWGRLTTACSWRACRGLGRRCDPRLPLVRCGGVELWMRGRVPA